MTADEWWSAGPGILVVGIILVVLVIWILVSYRKMRSERELALEELRDARRELDQSRRELSEAHRALDQARRDWQEAVRALTPRIEEHEQKISQVVRGLKQWQDDRRKLGLGGGWEMRAEAVMRGGQGDRENTRQQEAGLRTVFNSAVNRLKHLIEQVQGQVSSGSDD